MRLLITDGVHEDGRWVEVTGLGVGVDATGVLSTEAIARTIGAFDRFRGIMNGLGVERRMAIATSASRDAANREELFDRAEHALGVRPSLISGDKEARYAFAGATQGFKDVSDITVTDIGGGSTEFVTNDSSQSVDIGSVRLTERLLPDRPPDIGQLATAIDSVGDLLGEVDRRELKTHIGVAGTWTSIAAIAQELPSYDRERVHRFVLTNDDLNRVGEKLKQLTIEETATIPSLDPNRAPVILAGTVIATKIVEALGVDETTISEDDSLDGVAMELLALT